MKKTLLSLFIVLGLACAAFGQTALTQTTISSAVSGASVYYGNGTTSIDTQVTLNSVTGVTAAANATTGQFTTYLYIDRELMGVIGVNTTTKVVTVVRGLSPTVAQDHVINTMVLISPAGGLVSQGGGFQTVDPQGNCTTASTMFTPWVNVQSGLQWLCSTITKTWVPGFGNPGNSQAPLAVTVAVASAAGAILPSGPLFHVTGALAVTGFTVPVGFNGTAAGGGCFIIIPDGTFTWTTAGNIALAGTAVVNKQLQFCWDATNSKWVPSYIA